MARHPERNNWKQHLSRIPVLGPLARQTYRNWADALNGVGNKPAMGAKLLTKFRQRKMQELYVDKSRNTAFRLSRQDIFGGAAILTDAHAAQTIQDAITKIADAMPIIIFPSEHSNEISLGLREDSAITFRQSLSQHLGVNLQWEDVKSDAKLRKNIRTHTALNITVHWAQDIAIDLRITLFFDTPDKIDSRDNKNQIMRHIHGSLAPLLERPGCHLAADLLGAAPMNQPSSPVDVVYTWVNHDDPDWRALFTAAHSDAGSHDVADAHSFARFTNRDELRYSIRSVAQYMPWVRKIFIFTNCACPDWLTPSDRVVWVHHKDVIAPEFLPTFNSHAIEANLHLIPDLSENFIYFNDDFFVNQRIPQSYFFAANGLSNANLEDYGVVNGDTHDDDKDYLNAARNGAALLRDAMGRYPTRLHKHTPYALIKSVLTDIEARFPDAVRQTRRAQFRSQSDLSIASFFYHHYAYCVGRGTQQGYRGSLIKNTTPNFARELSLLNLGRGARVFCLNDGDGSHTDAYWNTTIPQFLQKRFPIPLIEENIAPTDAAHPPVR